MQIPDNRNLPYQALKTEARNTKQIVVHEIVITNAPFVCKFIYLTDKTVSLKPNFDLKSSNTDGNVATVEFPAAWPA